MESAESNLIKVTDSAIKKLLEIKGSNVYLRVAVVGGGCSGLSYKLSWVDQLDPKDTTIPLVGLWIVIDPKSTLFIRGLELDHSDGLDGVGFTFNNPNAKRSCGCGSSFST
jgi:iron-sulfur cluster assembly protein